MLKVLKTSGKLADSCPQATVIWRPFNHNKQPHYYHTV